MKSADRVREPDEATIRAAFKHTPDGSDVPVPGCIGCEAEAALNRLVADRDAAQRIVELLRDGFAELHVAAEAEVAVLTARLTEAERLADSPHGIVYWRHQHEAAEAQVRELREALTALDNWASSMPDAGFNNTSPRWDWWHKRPRIRARAALGAAQPQQDNGE